MSAAAETFMQITGRLDYPMLVVTTATADERAGCLVGFSTQCSVDPARFIVCLSKRNRTFRVAELSNALAVHLLPAAAIDLARLFGSDTGDDLDKFTRCRWHEGPRGLPILDQSRWWFAGEILERHRFGDHHGYLLEPFAAHDAGPGEMLGFGQVKRLSPGHEP
jgi:flavin reductase (DIM6/NTAB) family NADH-FMN oxidoreductase RutF